MLAILLSGCGPPPEAVVQPSARSIGLERPDLVPTSSFKDLMSRTAPKSEEMIVDSSSLVERASALQARAAGLSHPVIDAEAKARLEAAANGE